MGTCRNQKCIVHCIFKLSLAKETMVASPATPKIPHHARSISLPSRSHPLTLSVVEQLCRLRASETTISSSSSSSSLICHNLDILKELQAHVDDFLQLPLTQQALAQERHKKCVDEVLDGSVRLLDVCGTIRDVLSQMKEHVQDLQSAFRRKRGGEYDFVSDIRGYFFSIKKVKKEICKCLRGLKRTNNRCVFPSLIDKDYDLVAMFSVLREVETITSSVFESLLSFICGPKAELKSSGWSLVSKLMHTKHVACEGVDPDINEMEKVDAALNVLIDHKSYKSNEVVHVKNAQKRLDELESSIHGLEAGLEFVFRRLIRSRVSLLTILNH